MLDYFALIRIALKAKRFDEANIERYPKGYRELSGRFKKKNHGIPYRPPKRTLNEWDLAEVANLVEDMRARKRSKADVQFALNSATSAWHDARVLLADLDYGLGWKEVRREMWRYERLISAYTLALERFAKTRRR